jgi:hypothetical protein
MVPYILNFFCQDSGTPKALKILITENLLPTVSTYTDFVTLEIIPKMPYLPMSLFHT